MSTAITTYSDFKTSLLARQEQWSGVLPPDLDPQHFQACLLLHVAENLTLPDCTPGSLLEAIHRGARDGVRFGQEAYLVPFGDKVTYMLGYRGVLALLQRTGRIRLCRVEVVYERDQFRLDYGDVERPLSHQPAFQNRGAALGCYTLLVERDGTQHCHFMHKEDLQRAQNVSRGKDGPAWKEHQSEMWRKVCLKTTVKYIALTPALTQVLEDDDQAEEQLARITTPEQAQRNIAELFDRHDGSPELQEG